MWRRLGQKHCSDEGLLAYLDGELSSRIENATKKHLQACWDCRARLAELEGQAQALARSLAEQVFPGPDRIEAARQNLLARQEQFERSLTREPQFHPVQVSTLRVSLVVLTGVVGLAALAIWFEQPSLRATDALARAQTWEQTEIRNASAVHQSFKVQIRPIRPVGPQLTSNLDVWSEQKSGRFAARWTEARGTVRSAVWRPDPNREYFYPARTRTADPQVVSLSDLAQDGLGAEQLEAGFTRWLEHQHWQPVSLTSDFAVFVAENGVVLRAERTVSEDHRAGVRLVAQKQSSGLQVVVTVDLAPETSRPRIEIIRFETPERTVELRLIADRVEVLSPSQLRPAVFEPDPKLLPPTPVLASAPASLSPADGTALELDILDRLDQVGALVGEEVSVTRTRDQRVQVQGGVESERRKAEILQALAPVGSSPQVKLEVSTMTEAMHQRAGPSGPPVIMHEMEVTREPTPTYAELRRLYVNSRKLPAGSQIDEEVRQFSKEMLDRSQQALLQAWTLKHLAERFSFEELSSLRPSERTKWYLLIHRHAQEFRQETATLRQGLQPLFSPALEDRPEEGPPSNVGSDAALLQAIERLFTLGAAQDEAIRSAFVLSAETQSLGRVRSTEFWRSFKTAENLAEKIEAASSGAVH